MLCLQCQGKISLSRLMADLSWTGHSPWRPRSRSHAALGKVPSGLGDQLPPASMTPQREGEPSVFFWTRGRGGRSSAIVTPTGHWLDNTGWETDSNTPALQKHAMSAAPEGPLQPRSPRVSRCPTCIWLLPLTPQADISPSQPEDRNVEDRCRAYASARVPRTIGKTEHITIHEELPTDSGFLKVTRGGRQPAGPVHVCRLG